MEYKYHYSADFKKRVIQHFGKEMVPFLERDDEVAYRYIGRCIYDTKSGIQFKLGNELNLSLHLKDFLNSTQEERQEFINIRETKKKEYEELNDLYTEWWDMDKEKRQEEYIQ